MPNSRQVTPEAVDEEPDVARPANSSSNNSHNMEQDVVAGAGQPAAVGVGRRDENSISFRHFLQPHSDVVPAPPPTCRSRNSRGTQPGSVDLVDMAMTLPDFVQDHLVVESLAIAENDGNPSGASSLDLNILNEILPDFATSQPPHSLPSQAGHPRRRNVTEEPPALVPEVTHGAAALPDFLSDGPMQCTDTNVIGSSSTLPASSSSRSTSRIIAPGNLTERSRMADESSRSTSFDSAEPLRSEVDRLRRDVADRNRRISLLEGDIVRLRTNVNVLESALRGAEQNFIESEARRIEAERRVESLQEIFAAEDPTSAQTSSGGDGANNAGALPEPFPAQVARDIARSSETLISQLRINMERLQRLCNVPPSEQNNESKTVADSSENDGNGNHN